MAYPDRQGPDLGTRLQRRAPELRTVRGALALAAALLFVVAGILAIFAAADAFGGDAGDGDGNDGLGDAGTTGIIVLLLGLLLLGCAWLSWSGATPTAGVLGLVTGIILVVLYPETAGILAILGGVVALATQVAPARQLA